MAPEEALRYAKKEIRDAEPVLDDPDLNAPLFKNVSQFKRTAGGPSSTRLRWAASTPPRAGS